MKLACGADSLIIPSKSWHCKVSPSLWIFLTGYNVSLISNPLAFPYAADWDHCRIGCPNSPRSDNSVFQAVQGGWREDTKILMERIGLPFNTSQTSDFTIVYIRGCAQCAVVTRNVCFLFCGFIYSFLVTICTFSFKPSLLVLCAEFQWISHK